MKKKVLLIIAIVSMAFVTSAFVTDGLGIIILQVSDINPTGQHDDQHKGTVNVPEVSLLDHTLFFYTLCDGCTLNIVDSNDVGVYTTVIASGTTSLVLPQTLSGEYELQIICGNYLFYGKIDLP